MTLTYSEACKLIYELPKYTTKHTPEESKTFLDMLGHPEEGMRVLHVAGTNGKGSVCAYMESILLHAGWRTGCFISPHLVDMRERVRICGQMCSEEDFTEAVNRVRDLAETCFYPTFFEFLFFVGLLVFKKNNIDILVLETGLGGRLDATNLIENKELCVITSIGMDHMEYLGETIREIAGEKAGIMRADTPVVYWDGIDGMDEYARIAKAHAHSLSRDIISGTTVNKAGIDFCLKYKYDNCICLTVPSRALYQVENAALAVCSLAVWDQSEALSEEDYIAGIQSSYWPGRMECIAPGIVIDGAHNVPGTEAFLRSVETDQAQERVLIYCCMQDKQYMEEVNMIAESKLFDRVYTVPIEYSRALDPTALARCFVDVGLQAEAMDSVSSALEMAYEYSCEEGKYVYIAGSLYLIGEVRGLLT